MTVIENIKGKKWVKVFAWSILSILYFLILLVFTAQRLEGEYALASACSLFTLQLLVVYINVKWLVPQLMLKKKYLAYGVTLVILVAIAITVHAHIERMIYKEYIHFLREMKESIPWEGRRRPRIKFFKSFIALYSFFMFSFVALLSTSYSLIKHAQEKEKESIVLRAEKVKSEMSFLKSQINPHFLFNALNNIYSLVLMKSDIAPEMLIKLSDLLRYVVYDANEEKLPLVKELEYLKNYIQLQKLKDEDMAIHEKYQVNNSHIQIAPMIFVPFVENAFKHSKIEDTEKGWINVELESDDQQIHFRVSNSKPEVSFTKDEVGGIGIDNVRKRIEMIYPLQHQLIIQDEQKQFVVDLKIKITE